MSKRTAHEFRLSSPRFSGSSPPAPRFPPSPFRRFRSLLGLPHQLDHRHLRRSEKAYGRAPGAGAAADVKPGPISKVVVAGDRRKDTPDQEGEGKYLALVGMAGQLQVKQSD